VRERENELNDDLPMFTATDFTHRVILGKSQLNKNLIFKRRDIQLVTTGLDY
jgi:hypothetical protein